MKMTPDWEKCTSPVLDYFGLGDVTLIGVSLGGYLAARAAAFEPRIKRVVLYDIIYDFFGSLMSKAWWLVGNDPGDNLLPAQVEMLAAQLNCIQSDRRVAVLSTCAFFIPEYNPKLIR